MAQALIDWTVRNRDVLFEQIVRALDQMPADLREVFVLKHYEGKSPWEIAERMHVGTVEINDRISRANDVFLRTLGGTDGS